MKKPLTTLVALLCFFASQAQLNMSLLSTWDGNNTQTSGVYYNDIWGYVDDQGNEYAVLGSPTKVHFLDVTNPTNPVLKGEFTGGSTTIWRDMKSYDRYVYAVADQGSEGLMIFDMSALPSGDITKVYQQNNVFSRAHNIYIDVPNARLYVVGSNTQNSGMIVYSLADPANPSVIGNMGLSGGYVHDIFVKNNTAYCSHGYNGLYVYDCTNAASPVLKASLNTGGYNHSSWITEDGGHLIYAEEVPAGRPLGIIDLAGVNSNDISISSTFSYPLEAPGATNVTYHNPFIVDNYAIVSSYLDGVTIIDISNPSNPQRVAWYDTYPTNNNYPGLDGAWGVYPFFPSGNIIASDTQNGLFVLGTSINITSECGNGVQDAFEQGVDCGGFCPPCAAAAPTCDDGIQNGDETGVDCGGSNCPACPPDPTCDDGVQNGDEEGVDCGGSNCAPCPCNGTNVTVTIVLDNYPEETSWTIAGSNGATVASGGTYGSQPDGSTVTFSDCLADDCYDFTINDAYGDGICCSYGNGSYTVTDDGGNVLTSGGTFGSTETTNFCLTSASPTCDDGIQNGDETGIDCGGSDCPACPVPGCTDASAHNYDPSATVDDGSCETCTDGIQNGDETGVDCGGALCDPCSNPIPGCTDASAHNYDSNATVDDGSCETCTDGVQNGDETAVDCGGALCDACPVPGCTDASAHNYNPNATVDDGSCETCTDGVQNGDETGVDCGGALCSPCGTGCTYTTIDNNDFESGWGIWNDGGSDARRSANDAAYANSGSYCVRLRDNSGAVSSMTTDALNLSGYSEITISYSFYARSMENNEDFFVEINNGSGYTTVANYARGVDFNNNTRYNDEIVVSGPFSSATTLRIRCDASGNSDWVYIDDVNITGCANNFAPPVVNNFKDNVTTAESTTLPSLTLFPNPVKDQLNVAVDILEMDAELMVIDFTGKVLQTQSLVAGTTRTEINTIDFTPGYYFVALITADGNRMVEKFVVMK